MSIFVFAVLLNVACELSLGDSSLVQDFIEKKIVNGRRAAPKRYPHAVSLLTNIRYHLCGGSIISKDLVASACHCIRANSTGRVTDLTPESVYVRAGIINLIDHLETEQFRYVREIYVHPKCAILKSSMLYDFAVLRIMDEFYFNEHVQPIPLPFQFKGTIKRKVNLTYLTENRLYCTIAGWGMTKTENVSAFLMEVAVPLIPFPQCSENMFQITNGTFSVSDSESQLCTAVVDGKDACSGDSGSGLKCGKYLLGIVSWGYGCGYENYPSIFANVNGARNFFYAVITSNANLERNSHILLLYGITIPMVVIFHFL